ncbi:unnamed protein product [Caenorhabditis sp. 36 PRJEB53466]|nr:unnamed protein product [Caenorhabditis sp. 36 PRJEB53466]
MKSAGSNTKILHKFYRCPQRLEAPSNVEKLRNCLEFIEIEKFGAFRGKRAMKRNRRFKCDAQNSHKTIRTTRRNSTNMPPKRRRISLQQSPNILRNGCKCAGKSATNVGTDHRKDCIIFINDCMENIVHRQSLAEVPKEFDSTRTTSKRAKMTVIIHLLPPQNQENLKRRKTDP